MHAHYIYQCVQRTFLHQWPFSHLTESFNHIKAVTHAPVSHYNVWPECGTGPVSWTQESRTALQGAGLCEEALMCCDRRACLSAFPWQELPSPMLTARQPDELSVSSNSPHSSHSTAPPGRSRCFPFHWVLLLYSGLDAYLSSFHLAHGSQGSTVV